VDSGYGCGGASGATTTNSDMADDEDDFFPDLDPMSPFNTAPEWSETNIVDNDCVAPVASARHDPFIGESAFGGLDNGAFRHHDLNDHFDANTATYDSLVESPFVDRLCSELDAWSRASPDAFGCATDDFIEPSAEDERQAAAHLSASASEFIGRMKRDFDDAVDSNDVDLFDICSF